MKAQNETDRMSQKDLTALGLGYVAYIKPVTVNEVKSFAIHTADGNEVTTVPTQELAAVVIRQNDLEPLLVH